MDDADRKLTPVEVANPLWFKIKGILEARLKSARGKLEANLGLDETNRVRGEIIELKALLKIEEANPDVETY